MKTAYFDCFNGISGDMTLGALMDLGVPVAWLKEELSRIPLEGFDITKEKKARNGIHANRVDVKITGKQPSRNYAEIKKLIERSPLSTRVKNTGLAIFDKIAVAEAKIHHVSKKQVHFHEVGAVDSLVDILGTALCLEYLNIERVVSSKIPLGKGFVSCSHGTLPVPAPATLEILKKIPVYGSSVEQEIVTPTGAAIIATLAEQFGDMPELKIEAVGYGAGKRELKEIPNLLRIIKGVDASGFKADIAGGARESIVVIETNIDDMNPEFHGYLMEQLFQDGALDVVFIPIFMKKNRPGTLLQVLCNAAQKAKIIERILTESTAIGLRHYTVHRETLARESIVLSTRYGNIQVKQIHGPGSRVQVVPEYEACRQVARKQKIPLKDIYAEIAAQSPPNTLTKPLPNCRDDS